MDEGSNRATTRLAPRPPAWFGRLYMAAIAPFRHLIVYPALTRQWERAWRDRAGAEHREGTSR
ncbi:DUF2867 domain-containing protein [Thermocatellispora tengchongensis]|uniref:DUF2867 domain-containing protein n=1 Tax=Thermocatellispora tengchongensis TaxID=1073253 RepID=UPI0028B1A569|nr:DUF2867 domain-containing protein [Thermocatellispora tengchongensis]